MIKRGSGGSKLSEKKEKHNEENAKDQSERSTCPSVTEKRNFEFLCKNLIFPQVLTTLVRVRTDTDAIGWLQRYFWVLSHASVRYPHLTRYAIMPITL